MNVENAHDIRTHTDFQIDLHWLSNNETNYTVHQLIAELESTTTLTKLAIYFEYFEPGADNNNNRRFVEPLCLCIANLRLYNEHHPLHRLDFLQCENLCLNGMLNVVQQFLAAAKEYGISHLRLFNAHNLPIQMLMEFCRGNSNLKVLEMDYVTFIDGSAGAVDSLSNNRFPDPLFVLNLDKLALDDISFDQNATVATAFADLLAHMHFSVLELGRVDVDAYLYAPDKQKRDLRMNRIGSELLKNPLTHLTLLENCELPYCQAALEAGMVSVTDLSVYFSLLDRETTTLARVELLARMIRGAVQLNRLATGKSPDDNSSRRFHPPPALLQAMEACATVTRIQLNHSADNQRNLIPDQVQQLQNITERNEELTRFLANPITYPTRKLPALVRRFDHCPTGRYMLVRCFPEVFSLEKLSQSTNSRMTEPNQKKRKTN